MTQLVTNKNVERVGTAPFPASKHPAGPDSFRVGQIEKHLGAPTVAAQLSGYTWVPTYYSWAELGTIQKGDKGTKVAALQINLGGLTVDGDFGNKTAGAVKDWQTAHNLSADGVAGYKTQQSICVVRSDPARGQFNLPVGFLKGKVDQESGFMLAAYSPHPSDWGFDIGALQDSIGPSGDPADQAHYEAGYEVATMALVAGRQSRTAHDAFFNDQWVANKSWYGEAMQLGANYRPAVFAWQLAALSWNWPFAANNIATIGRIYNDPSQDDVAQQWIITASGGGLQTPRQWVCRYMSNATKYCQF
jgi:peptidoglycan hydrolase-like protein with peptidoglycan-binding domain